MFSLPKNLTDKHLDNLKVLDLPRWKPYVDAVKKLNSQDSKSIEETAQSLKPWKKGPFQFQNTFIDAEWDCQKKWNRLSTHLDLNNKIVLDIGTGNGWYLSKCVEAGAEWAIGFDPGPQNYAQWMFLQKMNPDERQKLFMLGAEDITDIKNTFDVIMHMGVLYHHRDPINHLVNMRETLKPGGTLYLETIGIPGLENHLLIPPDRYALMPNVWFLPTLNALKAMLSKARFTDIEVLSTNWDKELEQRSTSWSEGPSYKGALDPENPKLTVEGHPAPERFLIKAKTKVMNG
ncbi:MAG: tRNA 5-methoxyuridine(34)/uridine 5-oxyacetic acid(34) synthase CmoB [Bacteriovoracaceae bacterium]|nr:tRNA 5-methoxyuridine(34)/uridine 5-oxyacetic acid(34) synthase CmoB [Bacteriovoracaceae bacterium]